MNLDIIKNELEGVINKLVLLTSSTGFYAQLGLVAAAALLAYLVAGFFKRHTPVFRREPVAGAYFDLKHGLYLSQNLLFPLFAVFALAITVDISDKFLGQSLIVRIFEGLTVVVFIYLFIARFVRNDFFRNLVKWTFIPIGILQTFGLLDGVTTYLESIFIEIGNIRISAYGVVRVVVFGMILFWAGRISNQTGQKIIRNQHSLDLGTREILAKLFQVAVFLVIFLLLLQIMGINLTALAVFGGALGVGLGFGLQAIASNFISGIILLLERSLSVGDYIELADGRKGTIRQMNMRSTLLETYDGKDIMVPNEQFITSSFVNWTHKNKKQRYAIEFQVSYNTDLHALFDLLREVVAGHPKVLSGEDYPIEERPDAEIAGFGDSGVDILIEFWMEGIDDGINHVGADLLLSIWDALKENDIEIPYPQRDVRIRESGKPAI